MSWKDSLKQQLNIGDQKFILYVNFAPMGDGKKLVLTKSETCFKESSPGKYILCTESGGRWYWLTSHLSNYHPHVKNKHEIRYNTVYSIGGTFEED